MSVLYFIYGIFLGGLALAVIGQLFWATRKRRRTPQGFSLEPPPPEKG